MLSITSFASRCSGLNFDFSGSDCGGCGAGRSGAAQSDSCLLSGTGASSNANESFRGLTLFAWSTSPPETLSLDSSFSSLSTSVVWLTSSPSLTSISDAGSATALSSCSVDCMIVSVCKTMSLGLTVAGRVSGIVSSGARATGWSSSTSRPETALAGTASLGTTHWLGVLIISLKSAASSSTTE